MHSLTNKKYTKLASDVSKSELILLIIQKLKLDRRRKNDQRLIEHLRRTTCSMTTTQVKKLSKQSPTQILKFLSKIEDDNSSMSSDIELETFTSNQTPANKRTKMLVKRKKKATKIRRTQPIVQHHSSTYTATYDSRRGGRVDRMECNNGQCRRWSRKLKPSDDTLDEMTQQYYEGIIDYQRNMLENMVRQMKEKDLLL